MKKLIMILLAVLCAFALAAGCGGDGEKEDPALKGLSLNGKGALTWEKVTGASEYKVIISDNTKTVTENKIDLLSEITEEGIYTVTVKAYAGETEKKTGDFTFTAVKLGTPTVPVAETDPVTHAIRFVWQGDNNTRSFLQCVNDGKWITNAEGYYEVSATGSYSISVKAKGYASGTMLYLESDATAKSETVSHLQGPVLSIVSINVIRWSSDTEFDSYNLWVNGTKVKENVTCTEEGYNLILGSDPAITRTGEYDLQIEAVKNGASYFSNMLTEVGTSNINPNELYSFDNRVAKFTTVKSGVSVSDEQYHGDSGYSLRLEFTAGEQLNFIKYVYEGFDNDIDLTRIKKISYWIYVPSVAGYEGDTLPADALPRWKWETPWTNIDKDGNRTNTYKQVFFGAQDAIPFNTWVKVEIDNVENRYPEVFLLSFIKTTDTQFIMYIDDICYEELYPEDTFSGADYVVEYNTAAVHAGSWYGYKYTEMDFGAEMANQTFDVTMEVCGTANPAAGDGVLGLFYNVEPYAEPTDYSKTFIKASDISSTATWNEITVSVTTDENGKAYYTGMMWGGAGEIPEGVSRLPYKIYIRNVQVVENPFIGSSEMKSYGDNGNAADTYYQSIAGLKTDLPVGTKVMVTMDVYVTGTFNEYSTVNWVDDLYSVEGGESKGVSVTKNVIKEKDGWYQVSFLATVRNFEKLRFSLAYPVIDVSSYGNAVYLIAMNKTPKSFNYKNVTVEEFSAEGNSMSAYGDNGNTADTYYQSIAGLKTDYAVNTRVKVEMDVYVSGVFNSYSRVMAVETVWTADGGEKYESIDLTDLIVTQDEGWHHVTFYATVRNFANLRVSTAYPVADVSACGNAVYLISMNKSADSFLYKNVTVEKDSDTMPLCGDNVYPQDIYFQNVVGLKTDLQVGTAVTVEMDILVTGEYNTYSGIYVLDSVNEGGTWQDYTEIVSGETAATYTEGGNWVHITFTATVRDFESAGIISAVDVSEYGNAVYIASRQKTAVAFAYKNVTVTATAE